MRRLNIGVGVNAGVAYVGNVGGTVMDFTALGDTVNVAARLQSRTASGELILSEEVQVACEELFPDVEPRSLALKGRDVPVTAFASRISRCCTGGRLQSTVHRRRQRKSLCPAAALLYRLVLAREYRGILGRGMVPALTRKGS